MNILEDLGNMIRIYDEVIPAVNIQIENVPGFIEHGPGDVRWYGIYFEIMWETGELWAVSQGSEPETYNETKVHVLNVPYFGMGSEKDMMQFTLHNWSDFVVAYNLMKDKVNNPR